MPWKKNHDDKKQDFKRMLLNKYGGNAQNKSYSSTVNSCNAQKFPSTWFMSLRSLDTDRNVQHFCNILKVNFPIMAYLQSLKWIIFHSGPKQSKIRFTVNYSKLIFFWWRLPAEINYLNTARKKDMNNYTRRHEKSAQVILFNSSKPEFEDDSSSRNNHFAKDFHLCPLKGRKKKP